MRNTYLYRFSATNLIIMLVLTIWQVQRAYSKYELIQHKPQAVLYGKDLSSLEKIQPASRVILHDAIETQRFFIIEPAFKNHTVGVELLGITATKNIKEKIILHLGWHPDIQAAKSALKAQSLQASVSGILYQPKGKLLRQYPPHSGWPQKLSYIDLNTIGNALSQAVFPQIIVTDNSALYDSVENQTTLALGISRHICYAVQFLAFGIIGIYLSHRLARKKNATI